MQQQQVPLAGVVTSGGQLETRARIARGWLRRLGIADKMVSVAPGSRSKRAIRTTKEEEEEVEEEEEDSTCYIPKATHLTVQEATLYGTNETAAGAKLILAMVRQHAEKLEIIVMGKLTTLAHMHFGSRATLVYMPVKKVLKCYTYKVNAEPMRPNNVSCRISMLTFSKQTSRPPMLSLRRCKIPSNLFESISF